MIRRIREHNHLNGVSFVLGEFVLVTCAALLIAVGFARQGSLPGTVLAAGTSLNGLVVVGFGIAAYQRGERGASLVNLLSSAYRARVAREHPSLTADTLGLTAAVLVPYCLTLLVSYEAVKGSK
jgi:hypothetical protein